MRKRSAFALIVIFAMLISVLGGCKKDNNKPEINAQPITGGGDIVTTTEPTAEPQPTATDIPAATAVPTDEPAGTPEPTSAPTDIPSDVLTDPEASAWLGLDTPDAIKAANFYDLFLKGEAKVTVNGDYSYLEKGEFDIGELTKSMSDRLKQDMLPSELSKADYAILDCGMDKYPELALKLVYSSDYENATEYIVIKSVEGKLVALDTFQDYYRSYAGINRFGHVASGGSSGASSGHYESQVITAAGETVIDYIYNSYNGLVKPVIPSYVLPADMWEALSSFGVENFDGEGKYGLEIWSVNAMGSDYPSEEAYNAGYKEYLQKAVFSFFNNEGRYIMPDDKYVKACQALGLNICSKGEWTEMIDSHKKIVGITNEIFEGDDPEWYTIKGLAVSGSTGSTGTGTGNTAEPHPYADFLGTWYIMRGEVDGWEWDASEELNIQYLTFNEDYTVTQRIDYSLDYSNYNVGTCQYSVDEDGNGTVYVTYDDEGNDGEYWFTISDDGKLIQSGIVVYDGSIYTGTYAEYERKPFWGDGGYYYEVTAPVTPDVIKKYINEAKDDQWLVVLVDPDESIKQACDEGNWEVDDETGNQWISCPWNNPKELIIANASDRKVEIEVHEPASDYDPKSSDSPGDWVPGPFFYWAELRPGELTRMIVDLPDAARDATMCLYMQFEGDSTEYQMRIYKFNSSYFKFK